LEALVRAWVYKWPVFARWLSARMEEIGLTEEGVGAAVGVTQQTVSKWTTGRAKPRASRLRSLADVLQVSVDDLLTQLEEDASPVTPGSDDPEERVRERFAESDAAADIADRVFLNAQRNAQLAKRLRRMLNEGPRQDP
jgi:transcriptional regulator with XRE-family HTH domain